MRYVDHIHPPEDQLMGYLMVLVAILLVLYFVEVVEVPDQLEYADVDFPVRSDHALYGVVFVLKLE